MKTDGSVGNKIEEQPGEWLAWQLASARKASATDADEADAQAAAQAQAQAAAQPQSPYAQSYNRYGGSGSGYSSNRGHSAPKQSYTPSSNGGSSSGGSSLADLINSASGGHGTGGYLPDGGASLPPPIVH